MKKTDDLKVFRDNCNINFPKFIKILTGTPAGNIPLGRPRRRREDNIRMDLKLIKYEDLGRFRSGQGLLEGPYE